MRGHSALDVVARLTPGPAGRVWLGVLTAADGSELTEVSVDADGAVYLSRERSSTRPGTCRGSYRMPVGLDRDGGVDVRVLVDASVVEVFGRGGHTLPARVYPQARSSTGLVVGADAATGSISVQWWPVEVQGRSTAPTA